MLIDFKSEKCGLPRRSASTSAVTPAAAAMTKVAPLPLRARGAAPLRAIFLRDDLDAFLELLGPGPASWRDFLEAEVAPADAGRVRAMARFVSPRYTDVAVQFCKPLLLLFSTGAARCCRHVLGAVPVADLLAVREPPGNLLHALVLGTATRPRSRAAFDAALGALLAHLSEAELRRLNALPGHLGLRPAELAVRLDEFRLAERLLTCGALPKVRVESCGPHAFVTFDLKEYSRHDAHSRIFVSPLALLTEDICATRLQKIKESAVLRPDSLFHTWASRTSRVGRSFVLFQICLSLLQCLSILSFGSAYSRKRLLAACRLGGEKPATGLEAAAEIFQIVTISLIYGVGMWDIIAFVYKYFSDLRKLRYERKLLVTSPISALLQLGIPSFIILVALFLKIVILANPLHFCGKNDYWYHSFADFLFNCGIMYGTLYGSQMNGFFDRFLSNFFRIFAQMLVFLVFYLLVVLVSARTFENIHFMKTAYDNTTARSSSDDDFLFKDFVQSVYTSFRMSLHIMDQSREATDGVWMVAHVVYVVILPIMFFNYIIGVMSSSLSSWRGTERESAILNAAVLQSFVEFMYSWMDRLFGERKETDGHITTCLLANDPCLKRKAKEGPSMQLDFPRAFAKTSEF